MKKLAVLIPVYNCAAYVREALDSILNQTFADFTVFVVDDCSTDQTIATIEAIDDPRIKLIRRSENSGIVDTMNIGLDAIGNYYEFIARMDGDDISVATRFEKQLKYLQEHPDVGVVSTWYQMFDQVDEIGKFKTDPNDIKAHAIAKSPLCHAAAMMRTSLLVDNDIKYRTLYRHCEDYDLWYRLMPLTEFAILPELLYEYRITGGNVTLRRKEEKDQMSFNFMRDVILKDLAIEASQVELYYHAGRWEYIPEFTAETVGGYRAWLDQLIAQNGKLKVYPVEETRVYLEELWDNFFYRVVDRKPKLSSVYWKLKSNPNKKKQRNYLLKSKVNKILGRG
jgi:glycosyltransferase involved in cell wall biosynthesis